jgi:hypothetical protein
MRCHSFYGGELVRFLISAKKVLGAMCMGEVSDSRLISGACRDTVLPASLADHWRDCLDVGIVAICLFKAS